MFNKFGEFSDEPNDPFSHNSVGLYYFQLEHSWWLSKTTFLMIFDMCWLKLHNDSDRYVYNLQFELARHRLGIYYEGRDNFPQ